MKTSNRQWQWVNRRRYRPTKRIHVWIRRLLVVTPSSKRAAHSLLAGRCSRPAEAARGVRNAKQLKTEDSGGPSQYEVVEAAPAFRAYISVPGFGTNGAALSGDWGEPVWGHGFTNLLANFGRGQVSLYN